MGFHCISAILISCVILSSSGEQIGTTSYDSFTHPFGQRLFVDDSNQIHVNWVYSYGEYPGVCLIRWNFRFANGVWYGETDASPSISGHCQLDVMRGDLLPAKRTLNAWHYGCYSYISIDQGSGWGSWPGDTSSPHIDDHLWPYVACAQNNNIILASGNSDAGANSLHLYFTTNEGETWQHIADIDSVCSYFVRSSNNSPRVVLTWLRSGDVWFMYSSDCGVTWSDPRNITNYHTYPIDTVSAWNDVNAVFDEHENIHVAWTGIQVDTVYHCASKIFHWDEVSDTITVVNGNWWRWPWSWWLPAYEPQLISGTEDGYMYCLWHGQTDTTDTSSAGLSNGDLYAAYSSDNGITWSHWVNLTNTHSPGAPPGECEDEDYMTANPCVVNDSIFITYIVDRDTVERQGVWNENPVYCWVFHKGLITGIAEEAMRTGYVLPLLRVYPNPFSKLTNVSSGKGFSAQGVALKIYDATGRLVRDFSLPTAYSLVPTTVEWDGSDNAGRKLPAGVYFIELTAGDRAVTEKIVKLH